MSKLISLVAIGLGLSCAAVHAQVQVQKVTPQEYKNAMCEKAAGAKKGSERQSFIRSCMVAKVEPQMTRVSGCEHGSRAEDL